MSKVISFRAKKIDYAKPLPIYRAEQVPDFDELAVVTRGLPQVATGVEKEEEEEHHLQAVISASQVPTHVSTYIPTPSVEHAKPEDYNRLYPADYRMPKTLVHHTHPIEHLIQIPYNIDDDDAEFIHEHNATASVRISEDHFETVMDHLEKISRQKGELADLTDVDHALPKQYISALTPIYKYWHAKRTTRGHPLGNSLKFDSTPHQDNDPFVCFRRRELRHSRKTRRTDHQAYEKVLKLRSEMESLRTLLEMVCRRDRMKREILDMDMRVFEQRAIVRDWKRHNLQEQRVQQTIPQATIAYGKKPPKKNRYPPTKYHQGSLPTKLRIKFSAAGIATTQVVSAEERRRAALTNLVRERGITLAEAERLQSTETSKRRIEDLYDDFTDMAFLTLPQSAKRQLMRYARTALNKTGSRLPSVRRRIARLGRIVYDRMPAKYIAEHFKSTPHPTNLHVDVVKHARRFEASDNDDDDDTLCDDEGEDQVSRATIRGTNGAMPSYVYTKHREQEFYSYYLNHYVDAPGPTPLIPSVHHPSPVLSNSSNNNTNTGPFPRSAPHPQQQPSAALQAASATIAQLTQQRIEAANALKPWPQTTSSAGGTPVKASTNAAAAANSPMLQTTTAGSPLLSSVNTPPPTTSSVASRQLAAMQLAQSQQQKMATNIIRDQLLAKQHKMQVELLQARATGSSGSQRSSAQSSPTLRPAMNAAAGSPQLNLAFLQQQLNNPALAESARRQLQALLRMNKLANSPLAAAAQPIGNSVNPLASLLAVNPAMFSSIASTGGPAATHHLSNASAAAAMQAAATAASKMTTTPSSSGSTMNMLNVAMGRQMQQQQQQQRRQSTMLNTTTGSPRLSATQPQPMTSAQLIALQQHNQAKAAANAAAQTATPSVQQHTRDEPSTDTREGAG